MGETRLSQWGIPTWSSSRAPNPLICGPKAAPVIAAQTSGAKSDDQMKSDKMTMDHMKIMGDNVKMATT